MWKRKMLESKILSLRQERDEWKAKYLAITEGRVCVANDVVIVPKSYWNRWAEDQIQATGKQESLAAEVTKWKQMYADEVEKRVALIEQMKG